MQQSICRHSFRTETRKGLIEIYSANRTWFLFPFFFFFAAAVLIFMIINYLIIICERLGDGGRANNFQITFEPTKENWSRDGWMNVGASWNVGSNRKSWSDCKCGVLLWAMCVCVCVSVCLSVSVWLYVIFAVRSQDVSLKKQKSHLLLLYSCNPLSSDQIRSDEAQTIIMQNWANTMLLFLHCSLFLCAPHPLATSSDSTAARLSCCRGKHVVKESRRWVEKNRERGGGWKRLGIGRKRPRVDGAQE